MSVIVRRWRVLSAASTLLRAKGAMESNGKPRLRTEFARRLTFLLTGCPNSSLSENPFK
jgi:hypothetical protein